MIRINTETMKIIATKARRHQGFTLKKTFCVTLCLCVLVANFITTKKGGAASYITKN